jgi:hypothetical protein
MVVERVRVVKFHVLLHEQGCTQCQADYERQNDIKQKQNEKLAVGVTNTITNPRAVMIHV